MNIAKIVKDLNREISLNSYGLPSGFYRADLLPLHDYEPPYQTEQEASSPSPENSVSPVPSPPDDILVESSTSPTEVIPTGDGASPIVLGRVQGFDSDALAVAFVALNYEEGFPTQPNGDPYWLPLPHEGPDAYAAFQRYLQMSSTSPADAPRTQELQIKNTQTIANNKRIAGATGYRSIAMLAADLTSSDVDLLPLQEQLQEWNHLYYWAWRAKAYDLFRVARFRQQQEIRAIETQDSQYSMARRIQAKLLNYIEHDEEFMDQMSPKVALDGLKLTTSLERISAGLPAAGPAKEEGGANTMELTMRRITSGVSSGEEEIALEDGDALIRRSLENPEELQMMQEMILRITSTTP